MIDSEALILSLKLGLCSTGILLVIGLPLTFMMAKSRGRIAAFFEALFSLPLVLPPTVLGFYLLLLLGPLKLAFSFWGLLIASVITGIPFAFQSFLTAFRSVDTAYYENSWVLGEGRWISFWRIGLPLAKEGLISGAILAFAHCLGEFGVVLMIGGSIPGTTRTLSVSLYDQVSAFDYVAANQTAALLLSFSVLALMSISLVRGRTRLR